MRSVRVLGISLGTRKLGIAVLQRHSIFNCKLKSFNKKSWSDSKLKAILAVIERYLVIHHIKHIALKTPPLYTHSPAMAQLISGVTELAKAQKTRLYSFTIQGLKRSWQKEKSVRINKKQLKQLVLEKYNLQHIYEKEVKTKTNHYEKIFEAVGVADIVLRQLQ